jgi:hypothetical protein
MGAARAGAVALAGFIVLAAPAGAAAQAVPPLPIPENPAADSPRFVGSPAKPRPIFQRARVPRHPFMAANGRSNVHVDAYQTDVNTSAGPLGTRMRRVSTLLGAQCVGITFDKRGRIISTCIGPEGPRLVLLQPRSLKLLAAYPLPIRRRPGLIRKQLGIAGGGYVYLDNRDRVVVPTANRHIYVIRQVRGLRLGRARLLRRTPRFKRVRDYNLSGLIDRDDAIVSTLPDWSGRIWFVSIEGVVGNVNPRTGRVRSRRLRGEAITNSFAVDETGGVYVVSDRALYRFDAGPGGRVLQTWRERYDNAGYRKRGQVDDGSGTTPTVMGEDYVTITDNANPMNVVVYRRAERTGGEPRLVCEKPVFRSGASATDNSLIATDRSIVVENNFGAGLTSTFRGAVTASGIERIDLDRDGQGCHTVWRSREIAPSVVPKLSLATGLVYTYTQTRARNDPWYLTALDFRSGRTVFKQRAGYGVPYNNNYSAITIGPGRTAYIGVIGGLVALRDLGGRALLQR